MSQTSSDTGTPPKRHCSDTSRRGEPCRAWALIDSDKCLFHSPKSQAVLERARSEGGRVSGRVRQGRSITAIISRLYGSTEGLDAGFKPLSEADVEPPHGKLFIEINGHPKAVGYFNCDDSPWSEFVVRSPLDGEVHWLSDHPYALRQRALSLVGLRENTVVAGQRRYRYTDREGRPVSEERVETWLKLIVPEEPTR